MKIKINEDGFLQILRGAEYKYQYCPYGEASFRCGDWCPLFGQPEDLGARDNDFLSLTLCQTVLTPEEIKDERRGAFLHQDTKLNLEDLSNENNSKKM